VPRRQDTGREVTSLKHDLDWGRYRGAAWEDSPNGYVTLEVTVGLFRRKDERPSENGQASPKLEVTGTPLPASSRCQVAGVKFHQDEIAAALRIARPLPPPGLKILSEDACAIAWIITALVPLDDEHDPTAVGVYAAGAQQLGWIPAHLSADFREMLLVYVVQRDGNDDEIGICPAYIERWGDAQGLLGVYLCCSWPYEVLGDIDQEPEYELPEMTL